MPRRIIGLASRFFRQVAVTPACWNWNGARTSSGYGAIRVDRRTIPAHRISWLLHHGVLPPDARVRHLCENRACVNPRHLEVVAHVPSAA